MSEPAPLLLVAIGNASRGDDALGPALAAALQAEGCFDSGEAELLEVYQLQIEDALALAGRRAVLFIDAARAAYAGDLEVDAEAEVWLTPVAAMSLPQAFTHALAPAALLDVCARVLEQPLPEAWQLAIAGEGFELGAPLTPAAERRLVQATALARAWLAGARPSSGAASALKVQHTHAVHSVWLG